MTAPDAQGWRGMESAPRDYTHVIGMDAAGFVARTWYYAPSSRTFGWLRWGIRANSWWKPLFWLPLSPPPREGGG
jgi:hypothetical protein